MSINFPFIIYSFSIYSPLPQFQVSLHHILLLFITTFLTLNQKFPPTRSPPFSFFPAKPFFVIFPSIYWPNDPRYEEFATCATNLCIVSLCLPLSLSSLSLSPAHSAKSFCQSIASSEIVTRCLSKPKSGRRTASAVGGSFAIRFQSVLLWRQTLIFTCRSTVCATSFRAAGGRLQGGQWRRWLPSRSCPSPVPAPSRSLQSPSQSQCQSHCPCPRPLALCWPPLLPRHCAAQSNIPKRALGCINLFAAVAN